MKKILLAAVMLAMLTGCTRHTEFGKCVGVANDKEPNLVYEVSYWNAFMAFVFSETIIVPIVWVASDVACPVAVKPAPHAGN